MDLNGIIFSPTSGGELMFAREDINHHTKVFGIGSKGIDISPVAGVELGLFPIEYLDEFTEKSLYFKEIQMWKAKRSVKY